MRRRQRSFFRPCLSRVSDRSARVEVLRHPSESVWRGCTKALELFRHRDRRGNKVGDLVLLHEIWPEMQHKRCLDVAGVDAMRDLLFIV